MWLRLTTASHINDSNQVNSWKIFWKFWNGPLCRNKSAPSPLLNVAAYWQSTNTEACTKKLSQILANNVVWKQSCSFAVLQHWLGRRELIYFWKVDHSRISRNFSRKRLGLNDLCELLYLVVTAFALPIWLT